MSFSLFSLKELIDIKKADDEIDEYFRKNLTKAMKESTLDNKKFRSKIKQYLNY